MYPNHVTAMRRWLEDRVGYLGWSMDLHRFDFRNDIYAVTVSIDDDKLETLFALVWT